MQRGKAECPAISRVIITPVGLVNAFQVDNQCRGLITAAVADAARVPKRSPSSVGGSCSPAWWPSPGSACPEEKLPGLRAGGLLRAVPVSPQGWGPWHSLENARNAEQSLQGGEPVPPNGETCLIPLKGQTHPSLLLKTRLGFAGPALSAGKGSGVPQPCRGSIGQRTWGAAQVGTGRAWLRSCFR